MIVDRINVYLNSKQTTLSQALIDEVGELAKHTFKRQFMEQRTDRTGSLSLSSAGKCARQLAYAYHGYPINGKDIDPRGRIVFFYGDLIELIVINLAKLAGCDIKNAGLEQLSVSLMVGGRKITGHPDGTYEGRLVECKSMTSYSYDDFEKGTIDESYRAQINVYLEALNLDECVMIGVNKESGVMGELIIHRDPSYVAWAKRNMTEVLESTKDILPVAPAKYDPNEKGFYPWQCMYCAYYGHCRTNAERVVVSGRYKLKVKKIPKEVVAL